jgi:hypothetical protein
VRNRGSDLRIVGWIVGLEFRLCAAKSFKMWWPGTELNRRRQPFQGCALPPELPGHVWLTACLPARFSCLADEVWQARTLDGMATQIGQSRRWKRVEQARL